jgi:flagellar hook-associated protein 1 FlgK
MSSFTGLEIALSGLRAQQIVQETIGQNVANVNTPGYSRREVRLVPRPPADWLAITPQPGSGVLVAEIQRSTSLLLNQQIQSEVSSRSYWQTVYEGMAQVENLLLEPGAYGIGALANDFWASWHDLSIDPTNSAARARVRQTGDFLATTIRRLYDEVVHFTAYLNEQVKVHISRINTLAAEVAALNRQIGQAAGAALAGNAPNDLRDRRDMLLEELSRLAQVRSFEENGGRVIVTLGGHILVGEQDATKLLVEPDSQGQLQPVWSDDSTAVVVREGALCGTLALRDWIGQQALSGLQTFAEQLIEAVNTLHEGGFTTDGRTDIPFFAGSGAQDIRISDAVAADLAAIATAGQPDAPGDPSVALQIAALERTPVAALGDTLGGFYAAYVAQIGLDVQRADQMARSQDALVQYLELQRESLSGVSLDEEAVKMLGAQRAYQAAARMITAVDEMLNHIINQMGLVGR